MKIYVSPELVTPVNNTDIYNPASWAETVVGSVAGGVAGAIVTSMIPGPAIPG